MQMINKVKSISKVMKQLKLLHVQLLFSWFHDLLIKYKMKINILIFLRPAEPYRGTINLCALMLIYSESSEAAAWPLTPDTRAAFL